MLAQMDVGTFTVDATVSVLQQQRDKILPRDISRCLQIISESVAENKIKQLDLGK